jgi:hypothetical protein
MPLRIFNWLAKQYRARPGVIDALGFGVLGVAVVGASLFADSRFLPVPTSEGLVVIFVATVTSIWGLANTLRIYSELTSRISGLDELLAILCQELRDLNEIKRLRPNQRLYFYMYVRVPALGSISGDPDKAREFKTNLIAAAQMGIDVRIVCLTDKSLRKFIGRLYSNERGEVNHDKADTVLRESKDLQRHLAPEHYGNRQLICCEKKIFNSYRVVTSRGWFEFAMTPKGKGRQEFVGRRDKSRSGIEFAKDAFEEYWSEVEEKVASTEVDPT